MSSCEYTRFTAYFGKPSVLSKASFIISKMAEFVLFASLPPFKITALPDFIAKDEIWEITSGRASKLSREPLSVRLLFLK